MRHNNLIQIDSKLSSNKIESQINVSKKLVKYFNTFDFFCKYDGKIENNPSFLSIPALSVILPFAWIIGADVSVKKLDKTFSESMGTLQHEYGKIYPKFPTETKIIVDELVENDSLPDKTALLFSGGLDSTFSFFSHIDLKPRLLMLFGVADIPEANLRFQKLLKQKYTDFSSKEAVKINFIQTNALKILDKTRLDHLWWRFKGQHKGDFWSGVGYSLGHIGLVAPFSTKRFNKLIVASSREDSNSNMIRTHPHASSHLTDETIKWANLNVNYHGSINRLNKIIALKEFNHGKTIQLRVCWASPELYASSEDINCNACEKCLRTIVPLLLEGVNPNECGFNVNSSTLKVLKSAFEQKKIPLSHVQICWEPLQKLAQRKRIDNMCDSKHFFDWFRRIDLESYANSTSSSLMSTLYYKFPYSFSKVVRDVFHSRHQENPWYLFQFMETSISEKELLSPTLRQGL